MVRDKEEFRFDFKEPYIDYYHKIKKNNNINTKVDVFRYAIQTTFNLEQKAQAPYTVINPILEERIKKVISRRDIMLAFNISNFDDFLRNAVLDYLSKLEEKASERSLLHWDYRNSLQEQHKQVANTIYEIIQENPHGEIKIDELLKRLNWRNEQRLEEILQDFVNQNLLEVNTIGNVRIFGISNYFRSED